MLLSIRPHFVERILDGAKTVELRRQRPAVLPGELAFIYASRPVHALVGAFIISELMEASPSALWPMIRSRCGVTRREYAEYFSGSKKAVALGIESTWLAPEPVSLEELRQRWPGFTAPQSYRYLTGTELAQLPKTWSGRPSGPTPSSPRIKPRASRSARSSPRDSQ
jgi:predicted transcriptional regulator